MNEKKLKEALQMSKTQLAGYKPYLRRKLANESAYHLEKRRLDEISKYLDRAYRSFKEHKDEIFIHRYLKILEEYDRCHKSAKFHYKQFTSGMSEGEQIRAAVLKAYTSYPEAYAFLRNQMAIVKVSEDENFKHYLYRNYTITKKNNGGDYFASPNLNMRWYGYDKDLSKELTNCIADTLYEIKYEVDKNVMSIFAEQTELKTNRKQEEK